MVECSIRSFKIQTEVPVFLLFYAFLLSDSVFTNLIIYRTCYVTLGYNKSECALLGSEHKDDMTKHLEELVEPHAALISMTRSLSEGLIGGIFCLFIGPWSDVFGRKPIILFPLLGYATGFAIVAVISALPYASPWYFMLASFPVMLSGGFSCYITGVLSYISDVTSEANRGLRMGLFEVTLSVGILLANISCSYILSAVGYTMLFVISTCCCMLAFMYTSFCLDESVVGNRTQGYIRGLFQFSYLTDMFRTTVRKREKYGRAIIMMCIIMLSLYILVINGSMTVIFLYLREKFQWSLKTYTLYSSLTNVVYLLGTLIGIYLLHKVLKITESILILIGFISIINCALLQGLASKDWHIYFAAAVHGLSGTISPMVRSLVSKIVTADEIGKIFSVITVSESFIGLLGSPMYTFIYNLTINSNPGIFSFVSAGIYTFNAILTGVIIVLQAIVSQGTYAVLKDLPNESTENLPNENTENDTETTDDLIET